MADRKTVRQLRPGDMITGPTMLPAGVRPITAPSKVLDITRRDRSIYYLITVQRPDTGDRPRRILFAKSALFDVHNSDQSVVH